jgi:Transglycosylase-like domain/Putative peptidoglycan binding domain
MPVAAIVVRRLSFLLALLGLLALAAAVPSALATGGVAADLSGSSSQPAGTDTSALPGPGAVQAALEIPVTHQWDHRTREAIRAFQRKHRLVVDGIVGPQTAAALGLTTTATDASTTHVSAELQKIAACESGGDPTIISRDGRYRGKYQFTRSTWRQMGGAGDPARASESEQDRRAAKLLTTVGPSAWPTCG